MTDLSNATGPVHIDAAAVQAAVSYADAIIALQEALQNGFDPEADGVRTRAPLSHGEFLFMPAEVGDYAGVKVLTSTPDNPAQGLPLIQGTYLLLDARTHQTLATIDGIALTNLRTPAVSLAGVAPALAARHPGGVRMVLFGNGVQALPHVQAALAAVPLEHLTVVVRTPGKAAHIIDGARELGVPAAEVSAGSPEAVTALREARLVVTATSAAEPLIAADQVAADAIVVAMGAHTPQARELPGELLGRGTVVVESLRAAQAEAGDVIQAVDEGLLRWENVTVMADFTDPQAVPAGGPVVFKSVGMPWEDLVIGSLIYERVRAGA